MSYKEEFCIMPPSKLYRIRRFPGSERHEVFEGRTGNRDKSIEDGLVIFLTPQQHRISKNSIHKNYAYWLEVKKIAEKVWLEYYDKTIDEFRERYGRNFLEEEENV